jgi:hypothetical protein
MATEEYVPLAATAAADLLARARAQAADAVPGEVLWVATDAGLTAFQPSQKPLSGANSLVADLAATTRLALSYADPDRAAAAVADLPQDGEVFLVSDEHGVVGASDASGPVARRFAGYYDRLVGQTRPDQYDRSNLGIF